MGAESQSVLSGPKIVVVPVAGEYRRVSQLLQRFGTIEPSEFYNVMLLTVADIDAFITSFMERRAADERLVETISRLLPLQQTFTFSDKAEFELQAQALALEFAPRLEGLSFHVRMHRRGHHNEMSAQTEEQFLDHVLLAELERRGAPGRITFDDPDAILDVETVGNLAGMSLWTREDLNRLPFLRID
jgi:tRNA(Ser,Leu) C12 N-acetylase TAN1